MWIPVIFDQIHFPLSSILYTYMHSKDKPHRKQQDEILIVGININPCPAELLQLYFSSFEAGIANAISSFKWQKILLFMKNRHVQY